MTILSWLTKLGVRHDGWQGAGAGHIDRAGWQRPVYHNQQGYDREGEEDAWRQPVLSSFLARTILPRCLKVDGKFLPEDSSVRTAGCSRGYSESNKGDCNICRPEPRIADEEKRSCREKRRSYMLVRILLYILFSAGPRELRRLISGDASNGMLLMIARTLYRMNVFRLVSVFTIGTGDPEKLAWEKKWEVISISISASISSTMLIFSLSRRSTLQVLINASPKLSCLLPLLMVSGCAAKMNFQKMKISWQNLKRSVWRGERISITSEFLLCYDFIFFDIRCAFVVVSVILASVSRCFFQSLDLSHSWIISRNVKKSAGLPQPPAFRTVSLYSNAFSVRPFFEPISAFSFSEHHDNVCFSRTSFENH